MTIRFRNPGLFRTMPDAVLFDMDNTLYAYAPAHHAGLAAARRKVTGLFSLDSNKFDQVFNEARRTVKARLGNAASSHSRLLYFQQMLEMMGLRSQILLALDLEQTYWRTFLSEARLFDGVKEFLDDLRLAGIPTAIVTDLTAQIQFRKIIYFGLDHYFDYVVTSEEAGCDKPSNVPFDLALSKIKPKGNNIWMIGDHPDNDIEGARAALKAVTLQKIHEGVDVGKDSNEADAVFDDFKALQEVLRNVKHA